MRLIVWVLRAVMKLCGLVFALCSLSLVVGIAGEIFGFGAFDGGYPLLWGDSERGSFGEWLFQTGVLVLGAAVVGSFLYFLVGEVEELEESGYELRDQAYLWRELQGEGFTCPGCGRRFATPDAVARHYRDAHP